LIPLGIGDRPDNNRRSYDPVPTDVQARPVRVSLMTRVGRRSPQFCPFFATPRYHPFRRQGFVFRCWTVNRRLLRRERIAGSSRV